MACIFRHSIWCIFYHFVPLWRYGCIFSLLLFHFRSTRAYVIVLPWQRISMAMRSVLSFAAFKLFWLNKISSSSFCSSYEQLYMVSEVGFFQQNHRWIVEWIWKVGNMWILFRMPLTSSDGEPTTGSQPQPAVPLLFQSTIPLPSKLDFKGNLAVNWKNFKRL